MVAMAQERILRTRALKIFILSECLFKTIFIYIPFAI